MHAVAQTAHPVRQGLYGIFEVFVDTITKVTSCDSFHPGPCWSAEGPALSASTDGLQFLPFSLYFLPVALALYYAAPRRAKHLILTVLSYVFYGWASPLFVVLLLTSTAIDYFAGRYIDRERVAAAPEGAWPTRRARVALVVSMTSNLALLGFFKYFNFGVDSYNALISALGLAHAAVGQRAARRRCRSASASTRSSR